MVMIQLTKEDKLDLINWYIYTTTTRISDIKDDMIHEQEVKNLYRSMEILLQEKEKVENE
jgi:hypothetical protein